MADRHVLLAWPEESEPSALGTAKRQVPLAADVPRELLLAADTTAMRGFVDSHQKVGRFGIEEVFSRHAAVGDGTRQNAAGPHAQQAHVTRADASRCRDSAAK